MGYTVRLVPSGRSFTVEPNEPILEAGLRAGIDLRYNCANGTCGECRGRIVSGPTQQIRFHDYHFSEPEKQQGYTLLCSTGAAGDLVIEVEESANPAAIPLQYVTGKVYRLEAASENTLLLSVRTPRSRTLRFLAGQSVDLELANGISRRMAIGSCPCNGMILQFHLSRQPGDPFAEYIFSRARHGEPIRIRGPYGTFTLDEVSQRPIELLAWDTGFAPIKSVLEHAIQLERPVPMRLFWIAAGAEAHYLANYCRSLVDALDNFTFVPLVEGEDEPMARVLEIASAANRADWYIAGGPEQLLSAEKRLLSVGTPGDRLFCYREPGQV